MTNLPAKVLTYLLSFPDRVVSREELLDNIWEAHGLQPSGTALTQYISQIRRVFVKLGAEDDIIVTLPRAGFIISADYVERRPVSTHGPLRKGGNDSLYYFVLLLIAAFAFIALSSVPATEYRMDIPEVSIGKSLSTGGCMVHYLSGAQYDGYRKLFANRLKDEGPCNKNMEYFLSADTAFLNSGRGRVFIAKCLINSSHSGDVLHACSSYYQNQN